MILLNIPLKPYFISTIAQNFYYKCLNEILQSIIYNI